MPQHNYHNLKTFLEVWSLPTSTGGIVLFLMLLSGGFKYLTSGGDPKATEGAQKTLTYAIGGLVMLAGSYIILRIISDFTGADVTNFIIKK